MTALAGTLLVSGQAPVANFTATPTSGCSPLIVNFQDLSTGDPIAWNWNFGNGNTSALQNPTATYFLPGTYTVTLTVTNTSGTNTLTRTQLITVDDIPTVNFTVDNQSGCFPFRVQFTDLSTSGAGSTNVAWQWDFGDGNTSTLQNPSHTYTATGSYTVTLRVTTDKGCVKAIAKPNYITVTPGVTAAFTNTQPTVCSAPADINFNNTSSGPGTLSWQWDFGDGSPVSIDQNPSHTFSTEGNYTVTLITTSDAGCIDTARTTITIGGITAAFDGPDSVCVGSPAAFTNTSTPGPAGSLWVFGDGGTSTAINPTHVYANPGVYTVRLYNTYANCSDSTSAEIVVNALPVAGFTAPVTVKCEPDLTVTFQDNSTNATGWLWNFGDGNTSTDPSPTHTYTNYGNYTVTLIVSNGSGCTDTLVRTNYIILRRATMNIPGLPARGCVPFTFTFNPVINAVDAITSYQWSFGDGATSTAPNPTHTYAAQGTYTVRLYITTSTGCTDSLVLSNAVRIGTKPTADFSADPIPVCAFQPIQFTDLSTQADEWYWDFGDGSSSTAQNPSHIYGDTGYFNISLIATNNGCADTLIRDNYVQVLPPVARFIATANCSNRLEFSFTDQSLNAQIWSWDFGDGSPLSTAQNPVHVFPAYGSYTVTLTVTNGECTHSVSRTIQTINQDPDFSINANPVCRGTTSTFTPIFQLPTSIASLLWDFGNGVQLSSGVGPFNYQYPASGTYTVTLISTDLNGCRDTVRKTNVIRINGPIADFEGMNIAGCAPLTTTFNDLSTTDGVNAIVNWTFDFGDGTIQSFFAPPFQHTYNTPGTYSVKMTITDASGCSDSLSLSNLINATNPQADFSADTLSCPGGTVRFVNTSTGIGLTSLWDFGDGSTSTTTTPTHSYAAVGLYTVTLVVTDAYGCSDTAIKTDYIRIDEPVASFIASDTLGACIPMEVRFTNTSQFYIASSWDFGDGAPISTAQDPSHFYVAPGTYTVRLIAISPGGCRDTAYHDIVINDTAGTTLTYSPLFGCNPLPATFSISTPATISSYFWDFGDGATLDTTATNVTHTYNSYGNFQPKVIMIDPAGCLIPVTGLDTIRIIGANIDFGITPQLLCDSGYVSFSDSTTSSDRVTSYAWTFGDGGTSTEQNPVHLYTTPGIFDVTLTVQTESGCTNSFTWDDAVKVVLRPLIRINGDNEICVFDSILHSGVFIRPDTSLVTWSWTFPNGNTSDLQHPPFQTYTQSGNFTVTAIATNSSGCKDTATQDILIHPLPTVVMPDELTIQVGFPAAIPTSYSTGTNRWLWTPSTGLSCTNCPSPQANPRFNTLYRVDFSDENGCRNNDSILVLVVCKDGNVFVPNTFSPNGDGSNDVFYPRGRGIYMAKSIRIFNRWGEMVFEKLDFPLNNVSVGWDGRYKGKDPHPDVYVYQIEVFCDNGELIKLTGNVALIL